ncbi:tetratricopeptide repeat-containing sensor histidine kinase [Eudoraea sp.]|uniref:tetratricopeptide repeat-containing sensor histidine kinase n=2 Tax=Eudoraea sp. TaxID=1979955 RepID=UPI003C7362F3
MPFILTYIRTHFIDVIKHAAIVILVICSMTDANAQQELQKKYKDSIRKLKSQKDFSTRDTLYIDLLNELGSQLRYYNTDSLLLLSKEALQLSIDSGYKEGECRSRLRLGDYFSDKGDSDKAIYNYKVGHEIAKELGNKDLSLRIINNLAGENAYKGDYAHALTGYLEAIEIAEEIDDKKMLSIMNENIANLYASQKDYEQSLDFYKKVKKINGELGNEIIIAETLSNLASVYADMGKLDYAMFNINSSVGIFEKHKIIDWLAFTYEIKGKIYLKENKYKWALYWYNQSELLHRSLDDDRGKIDLYNGMAEAYLGQGKDSISEKIALQAYAISDRIQFMEGTQKCAYTLYRINKNKKNYSEALNFHELYQKLSDTLSRNENKKSLTMLKTKTEYDKQKQTLIAENEKALAQQQRYIIAALAILVVFIVIIILVYRAEKIQKRLNKELEAKKEILEKRESELQDSNETKTKLFSIIGHDLRGPVGALQELLRLYSDGDIETDEFLEFVPKLREDVDHISFTLNNLLSWGHTQMNGAVTKPSLMALESLVSENIKLLSEIAKKKSIKIVSELVENTLTWSDSNQIDIVVRNLISNALKFTPQNGMITISARERDNLWEVSIKDTGVGMDKITVKNLFEKNSNITTYGTANEKGTGLGLALCKEMVEKNGGSIWVESALRKGSCFFFTLPKREKSYSQAV